MSGSYSQTWAATSTADMGYNLNLATSSKTRLGFSFNQQLRPYGDSRFGANWIWNISSYLSWHLDGTYVASSTEVDAWTITSRWSARYSVL
jgi:hypothetical protein